MHHTKAKRSTVLLASKIVQYTYDCPRRKIYFPSFPTIGSVITIIIFSASDFGSKI